MKTKPMKKLNQPSIILKLRKIKRMLLENQVDLEKKHTPEEYRTCLHQTHEHLKQMEMEITRKIGSRYYQIVSFTFISISL